MNNRHYSAISEDGHIYPSLSIRNLSICYPTQYGAVQAVQQISVDVYPGKTLVILGESGCGKSTLGRALLGLLPPPGTITQGSVFLATQPTRDVTRLTKEQWRKLRGKEISLILQDPVQALNPVLTIGFQMVEALQAHKNISNDDARAASLDILKRLKLQDPVRVFTAYPFQLSGGMCQRVAIAIALANNARILVADEPTTALDVRVQASILTLIKQLQKELQLSLVLITHDIGVAADIADEVAVMYAGRLVEVGPARQVLYHPLHPYTRSLLNCFPHDQGTIANALPGQPPDLLDMPEQCPFLPRCTLSDQQCRQSPFPVLESVPREKCHTHRFACYHPLHTDNTPATACQSDKELISVSSFAANTAPQSADQPLLQVEGVSKSFCRQGLFKKRHAYVLALDNVSLTVQPGEVLGIVGESGCGKTTLARCILGLEQPDRGQIFLNGENLSRLKGEQLRVMRQHIQPVFQSPRGSLNSRRTALELVQEPLNYFQVGSAQKRRQRASWLLDMVGLGTTLMERKPNHLSTGQCQRVAIARALALEPQLLLCDEPVSSLDLSVQAQILHLLARLHSTLKFGMIFISHNILVVQSISKRIIVMQNGKICETLSAGQIDETASHPYTLSLFDAVPRLDRGVKTCPGSLPNNQTTRSTAPLTDR